MSYSREWLDSSGRFMFGKYGPTSHDDGELAEDVAREDPSYIRWIVNDVEDISDDDREVLSQYLTYASRSRGR